MDDLYILGGAGIFLLIICLVVRSGTTSCSVRKRTELMSLCNQGRGLKNQIQGLEQVQVQLREAIGPAKGRSL